MPSCQSTPPDLARIDLQMPGMDGLKTSRRLRAFQDAGELRRLPIIALTADAMGSDREATRGRDGRAPDHASAAGRTAQRAASVARRGRRLTALRQARADRRRRSASSTPSPASINA